MKNNLLGEIPLLYYRITFAPFFCKLSETKTPSPASLPQSTEHACFLSNIGRLRGPRRRRGVPGVCRALARASARDAPVGCARRMPGAVARPPGESCALQGARARKWGGVGVGWWMGAARAALCGVFPGARPRCVRSADALQAAQMKSDRGDGKVNRRVVLALATLPLLGLRKAEAMTDAEEIVKLQAEAARIQEIFDVQKAASANLPSLKDSLKVAKSAAPNEEQVAKGPLKSEDPAGTLLLRVRGIAVAASLTNVPCACHRPRGHCDFLRRIC